MGTWITLFGKTFHTLRAPRVLFPLFVVVGVIITTDPLYPKFQWWDWISMLILSLGIWFGFTFFSWSYFKLFPVKYQELDDEQKHDFLRGIAAGVIKNPEQDNKYGFLTPGQRVNFTRLTYYVENKYKGRFAGLKNLIPLTASILLVVVWYLLIFPYFNEL